MKNNYPTLFVEINDTEFIFVVSDETDNHPKILYHQTIPLETVNNQKIFDHSLYLDIFKKNIFLVENKLKIIFKEVVLILNNFNSSTINLSGLKKLNGSQLLKENVTYLLNSLKSKIQEIEDNKKIIHIFNSNFYLDKKPVINLPIGLFGNIYCHELSFFLINSNDYKNLKQLFSKSNLRLKKIISKSFIEGINIINDNSDINTFFKVKIGELTSQIIYFENSALKYVQSFEFGSDLVLKDISKIIGFKIEDLKYFLSNSNLNSISNDDLIEKKFFKDQNFRKIKKKLIKEIAEARIIEIAQLMLHKNINLKSFLKTKIPIFLELNDKINLECFESSYRLFFSDKENYKLNFYNNNSFEKIYENLNKLVQFGWNKEAVPVVQEKKSLVSRIFDYFT